LVNYLVAVVVRPDILVQQPYPDNRQTIYIAHPEEERHNSKFKQFELSAYSKNSCFTERIAKKIEVKFVIVFVWDIVATFYTFILCNILLCPMMFVWKYSQQWQSNESAAPRTKWHRMHTFCALQLGTLHQKFYNTWNWLTNLCTNRW